MNIFAHYDKVEETLIEPIDFLTMNRLIVDEIESLSSDVVIIAGEPIGIGAPASTDLIIGAPIAPVDGNSLKLTGVTLSAEYGDATHPGILSLATQDIVGQKRFTTGIRTNDIDGTAIMSVGDGSTGLILTAGGDIDLDGAGIVDVGTIQSTAVNVGKVGINTTVLGTLISSTSNITNGNITTATITTDNITTANITTANITNSTVSGTANITTIDRSGPISIGPVLCTALNLGRAAITTTINGTASIATENVTTSNITTANITNTTVSGTANIAVLDRAGTIAIGTTNGTGITIGRAGQTTFVNSTLEVFSIDRTAGMAVGAINTTSLAIGNNACTTLCAGNWGFARLDSDSIRGANIGNPMVIGRNSNNGMNLGAEMGAMVIDHFTSDVSDTMAIGTTNNNAITIGRTGKTATVNSLLSAQAGVQFLTSGGTPATLNDYEEYTHVTTFTLNTQTSGNINLVMVKVGKAITMRCDSIAGAAVAGQAAPGASFVADTVLPARFRPSMDCSQLIGVVNNNIVTVGRAVIGSTGSITLFAGPDAATTYTALVTNGFTRFTFAYTL